jgi:iron complex outermembrane receptor protein
VLPIKLRGQTGPTDSRGCVVDHLGGENVQSARAAFRFLASEKVDVNVIGDYTYQNQEGPADKYTFINGAFGTTATWNNNVSVPVFGLPYDSRFLTNDPYSGYGTFGIDPLTGRDIPNVNKVSHWGLSGTVEWQLSDSMGLKLITASRDFENSFGRDSDGSPLPVNPTWDTTTHDQFTQEIQLSGQAGKLDWTTGAFY